MGTRARPLVALSLVATLLVATPRCAFAQSAGAASSSAATAEPATRAKDHFLRAQELYQQGSYRAAIVELEAAIQRDPRAKDLYFNLGVVHERLGRIDEALSSFHKYLEFELTTEERARVDKVARRLEGAKQQLAAAPSPTFLLAPGASVPPPEKPVYGRLDGYTIAAGSASIVALTLGAVFAIRASDEKPRAGYVTGRDGTYADLEASARSAQRVAVVADVTFAIGIAAAGAAAYLYFARTRAPARPDTPPSGAPRTPNKPEAYLAPTPLPGGGALVLGGRF